MWVLKELVGEMTNEPDLKTHHSMRQKMGVGTLTMVMFLMETKLVLMPQKMALKMAGRSGRKGSQIQKQMSSLEQVLISAL